MAIDAELLGAQMKQSRFANGRFERLVNGEWVEWPVLRLDKLGLNEAKRVVTNSRPRTTSP